VYIVAGKEKFKVEMETKRVFLKQNILNWRNLIMEQTSGFSGQRRFLGVVMAACCLLAAFVCPADAVWQDGSGDIIYGFSGPTDIDMWDISGTYSDTIEGIHLSYTISQDSGGKLIGTGSAWGSVYGADFTVLLDTKGTVGTKNNAVWVKMTLKGKGTVTYEEDTIRFGFSATANAQVDPVGRRITGTVKVRVSAAGHSASETVDFDEPLPADMNGSSSLSLNCTPNGKNLLGTSVLTLSNGDPYNFSVKGKYNGKKNETTLTLKGDAAAKKNSLKIKLDGTSGSIKALRGKVLGQKVVK
jgi:hypothetical protein